MYMFVYKHVCVYWHSNRKPFAEVENISTIYPTYPQYARVDAVFSQFIIDTHPFCVHVMTKPLVTNG